MPRGGPPGRSAARLCSSLHNQFTIAAGLAVQMAGERVVLHTKRLVPGDIRLAGACPATYFGTGSTVATSGVGGMGNVGFNSGWRGNRGLNSGRKALGVINALREGVPLRCGRELGVPPGSKGWLVFD